MKKLYILIFSFLFALGFSQNSELLNTNWQVTKMTGEMFPEQFPPSMPFQQTTKFETSKFTLSFFNNVSADVTYNSDNQFTINNKACTFADYWGDNGEVNQFFELMCNFFQKDSNYYYYITNNGSEKTLVIGDLIFQSIHFKSVNLNTKENELIKVSIYPNPATDIIKIDNLRPNTSLELIDSSGKLIKSVYNNKTSKNELNIKDLSSGIYYLKVDGKSVQKIIKK